MHTARHVGILLKKGRYLQITGFSRRNYYKKGVSLHRGHFGTTYSSFTGTSYRSRNRYSIHWNSMFLRRNVTFYKLEICGIPGSMQKRPSRRLGKRGRVRGCPEGPLESPSQEMLNENKGSGSIQKQQSCCSMNSIEFQQLFNEFQ